MTTTEQYDAAKWDAYNESTLIRGLVYAKYDDIRSICRGCDPEAFYSEPRRAVLRALLAAAHASVATGAGNQFANPGAVIARLQFMDDPAAKYALTHEMPEIIAATIGGKYATVPAVHELPLLWDAVEAAHLRRTAETFGTALIHAAQQGDMSALAYEVGRLTRLREMTEKTTAPVEDINGGEVA